MQIKVLEYRNSILVGETRFQAEDKGATLLKLLRQQGIFVPALCNGRGTCGKCKVQLKTTEGKWEEVLACTIFPEEDLVVGVEQTEQDMEVLLSHDAERETNRERQKVSKANSSQADVAVGDAFPRVLGVDIGTTTIAMELQDCREKAIWQYACLNAQRQYGADVLSRIQAAAEGEADALRQCIGGDLRQAFQKMFDQVQPPDWPERIVIAGNTTMLHLLLGLDTRGLGRAPFTPVTLETMELALETLLYPGGEGKLQEVMGLADLLETTGSATNREQSKNIRGSGLGQIPVVIMPGLSAFVGADITADLLVCSRLEQDQKSSEGQASMLIDLGTNGEMALWDQDRLWVTSVAAGPAFEGGNISAGTGSIPGAISAVRIQKGSCMVKTIQGKSPVGICGSGLIEAIYELRRAGLLSEDGLLAEEYQEKGYPLARAEDGRDILLTQQDIRQFQLAKAAVAAGITLLWNTRLTSQGDEPQAAQKSADYRSLKQVYLAGGFGYHIDLAKAIKIGLLPEQFCGKITVIGNGALQGAMDYGQTDGLQEQAEAVKSRVREIQIAQECGFQELYMECMKLIPF